jgi:hypothetical protein
MTANILTNLGFFSASAGDAARMNVFGLRPYQTHFDSYKTHVNSYKMYVNSYKTCFNSYKMLFDSYQNGLLAILQNQWIEARPMFSTLVRFGSMQQSNFGQSKQAPIPWLMNSLLRKSETLVYNSITTPKNLKAVRRAAPVLRASKLA